MKLKAASQIAIIKIKYWNIIQSKDNSFDTHKLRDEGGKIITVFVFYN